MSVIVAGALGALTWTLLEYMIHRWMGHDRRFRRTPFGIEHVRHHSEGNYFSPSWKKVIIASVVAAFVSLPAIAIAGPTHGLAYVGGLVVFYTAYEVLHRREHTCAGIGPYGRWARRHHFHHHFVDPHKNHGVTSPLWDLVFGTYEQPTVIPVPRKLSMSWLVDPATGDVHPAFASTYRLR